MESNDSAASLELSVILCFFLGETVEADSKGTSVRSFLIDDFLPRDVAFFLWDEWVMMFTKRKDDLLVDILHNSNVGEVYERLDARMNNAAKRNTIHIESWYHASLFKFNQIVHRLPMDAQGQRTMSESSETDSGGDDVCKRASTCLAMASCSKALWILFWDLGLSKDSSQ